MPTIALLVWMQYTAGAQHCCAPTSNTPAASVGKPSSCALAPVFHSIENCYTAQEIYTQIIRTLSPTERLRLATLILNDLVAQNVSVINSDLAPTPGE